ncbi:MAG: hypothetical protein ACHREM_07920 [Polyangiales bacterium]
MIVWVIGCAVVGAPVVFATRVLKTLRSQLGAVDAASVAEAMLAREDLSLETWSRALHERAPKSIASRLFQAVEAESGTTRTRRTLALAEAVSDIERELSLDVRLPRIAASLSSTSGLLAASFVMRSGLAGAVGGDAELAVARFTRVVEQGLTLATLAILGGLTCAAVHRASQKERRARLAELDSLSSVLLERIDAAVANDTSTTIDRDALHQARGA